MATYYDDRNTELRYEAERDRDIERERERCLNQADCIYHDEAINIIKEIFQIVTGAGIDCQIIESEESEKPDLVTGCETLAKACESKPVNTGGGWQ